jgi:Zn-dependent protease
LNARSLKLGRFLGIKLYVHWTFSLLVLYVAYLAYSQGGGPWDIAYQLAMLLTLFLCVTLHEYGHAMAARAFGIRTLDITLLPIGGLARLERMPRIPWQELIVAVAGPAVNVVIALVAGVALFATGILSLAGLPGGEAAPPVNDTLLMLSASFLGWLFLVNMLLVVFNMIPAFPMDGGRVLRSLLAMVTDYRRATWMASRVGLLAAILMGIGGLMVGLPFLPLIALFIAWAGYMEARQVELTETVRGIPVSAVMTRRVPAVPAHASLGELVDFFRSYAVRSAPVVGSEGHYLGQLRLEDVAAAIRQPDAARASATDLMQNEAPTTEAHEPLEKFFTRTGALPSRSIAVLDGEGRVIGTLDLDSLMERLALISPEASGPTADRLLISPPPGEERRGPPPEAERNPYAAPHAEPLPEYPPHYGEGSGNGDDPRDARTRWGSGHWS